LNANLNSVAPLIKIDKLSTSAEIHLALVFIGWGMLNLLLCL